MAKKGMESESTPGAPKPKKRVSRPTRPVVCVENGTVYPSAAAVAEALGLKSEALVKTAIRESYAAGGLHWRWAEDKQ